MALSCLLSIFWVLVKWEAGSLEPFLCLKTLTILFGKGQAESKRQLEGGQACGAQETLLFTPAPQLAQALGCFEATSASNLFL